LTIAATIIEQKTCRILCSESLASEVLFYHHIFASHILRFRLMRNVAKQAKVFAFFSSEKKCEKWENFAKQYTLCDATPNTNQT